MGLNTCVVPFGSRSQLYERNWSIYGQIRAANRSRMLGHAVDDKLEAGLILSHESLHLRDKLLDAAWFPEFKMWKSDEESDEGEGADDQNYIADSVYLIEEAILCCAHRA